MVRRRMLRARVKRITGATRHLANGSEFPPPAFVEIVEVNDGGRSAGFHLEYFDANGEFMTDTWHPTLPEAKAQATYEFETAEDEWMPIPDQ